MEKKTGLGGYQVPPGVLSRTVPRDDPADATDARPDDAEQGRGADGGAEPSETKAARPRGKRQPAGGKVTPRKISMPDALYRRLSLWAVEKNSNVSELAVRVLDQYVPDWDLSRKR